MSEHYRHKLAVIHNIYLKNPYIRESLEYNLCALIDSQVDFEYVIFNDNGDKSIYDDIYELLDGEQIRYIYSDINYGKKMCTGGWIGCLPYLNSKYIHNFSQDDVATEEFYKKAVEVLDNNENIYLVHTNMVHTDEQLNPIGFQLDPKIDIDMSDSNKMFHYCFGIDENNRFTRANNIICAPAAIYRSKLHELIGIPNIIYRGCMDFEYWMRILFNGYEIQYIKDPLIYYRNSSYSAGNEIIDGQKNRGYWQQKNIQEIKSYYEIMWNQKCQRS